MFLPKFFLRFLSELFQDFLPESLKGFFPYFFPDFFFFYYDCFRNSSTDFTEIVFGMHFDVFLGFNSGFYSKYSSRIHFLSIILPEVPYILSSIILKKNPALGMFTEFFFNIFQGLSEFTNEFLSENFLEFLCDFFLYIFSGVPAKTPPWLFKGIHLIFL